MDPKPLLDPKLDQCTPTELDSDTEEESIPDTVLDEAEEEPFPDTLVDEPQQIEPMKKKRRVSWATPLVRATFLHEPVLREGAARVAPCGRKVTRRGMLGPPKKRTREEVEVEIIDG